MAGEQLAIVDRNLFDAVQAKLDEQLNNHNAARTKSEALLTGRIFDDRGNRMSPSHARKRGIKYRYYLSAALNQGHAERAGSIRRVPAVEVEALVTKSVREHLKLSASFDDLSLVNTHLVRIEVQASQLAIQFAPAQKSSHRRAEAKDGTLLVPWQKTPSTRRREILLPGPGSSNGENARPIRSETRATLVASIARGRRWLDEIISDPSANAEAIAARESCSIRKVNMMISLAFLAPHLVKAAIEGRLPHGTGVVRLCDLSAEWSRQTQMLGLVPQ